MNIAGAGMRMFLDVEHLVEIQHSIAAESNGSHIEEDAQRLRLLTDAWYTLLVKQSLDWAEHTVPYYRKRSAEGRCAGESTFRVLSDLHRFPVLTRADLSAAEDFLSASVKANGASSTSGTTGRRLTIYGCEDENRSQAAIRRLRRPPADGEADVVVLRIIPGNRRTHIAQTSSNAEDVSVITVGYLSSQAPAWFDYTDHLIEVLTEPYRLNGRERRVSVLHVTPPVVLDIITQHLQQKHIDPRVFGVTDIAVSGAFLSPQTRRLITECWGARWHHSYSCAEINGEMNADHDDPSVFRVPRNLYCEILDRETLAPVEAGEAGLVVLTSLYPFQKAMPFIRYANGDIAQRVDDGETPYVEALRPIGRTGDVIELAPRRIIGTRDAFAAVTSYPEIPQVPYPRFRMALSNPDHLGLDVEVALPGYSPTGLSPDDVAGALHAEIARYGYPTQCLPRSIDCRFLPKLSIDRFPRIVPDR